jgi:NTP pyrophosphatase (non-canonical NTP hydrolase)
VTTLPERLIDTTELAKALDTFAADRDWAQFHSPKNLVMALTGEVGELNELFQWLTEQQSIDLANDPERKQRVGEELADVLFYLVRIASVMGVDLNQASVKKLALNAEKYPADKSRGSNKKYSEL